MTTLFFTVPSILRVWGGIFRVSPTLSVYPYILLVCFHTCSPYMYTAYILCFVIATIWSPPPPFTATAVTAWSVRGRGVSGALTQTPALAYFPCPLLCDSSYHLYFSHSASPSTLFYSLFISPSYPISATLCDAYGPFQSFVIR